MKFTLEINLGNAAFEDYPEIELSRILCDIAYSIRDNGLNSWNVQDCNGNTVGRMTLGK